jgi:hypothetical protein
MPLLQSYSPSVQPELSHALYLLTILMILHAADRQFFIITFLKIAENCKI